MSIQRIVIAAAACSCHAGCDTGMPEPAAIPPISTDTFLPAVADQLQALRAEVEHDPGSAEAAGALGMACMTYDLPEAAVAALERAHRLQPGNWQWHYLYGLALTDTGDFDGGVAALEAAAARHPGQATIHLRLGQAYAMRGEPDRAEAALTAALASRSDLPEAVVALAGVRVDTGRAAMAIPALEALLQQVGPAAPIYFALARASRRLGDGAGTRRYLALYERHRDRVLPSFDDALLRVAQMNLGDRPYERAARHLLRTDRTDAAIAAMHGALERNPANLAVREALILEYAALGRFELAGQHFDAALARGPPRASLLRTGARLRIAEGRLAQARALLRRAVELEPVNAQNGLWQGIAARRQGDAEAAADGFRRALELDPQLYEARLNLAELLLIDERFDEAVVQLELLAGADSALRIRAMIYLGQALFELGRRDDGRDRLERAAEAALAAGDTGAARQATAILDELAAGRRAGPAPR